MTPNPIITSGLGCTIDDLDLDEFDICWPGDPDCLGEDDQCHDACEPPLAGEVSAVSFEGTVKS